MRRLRFWLADRCLRLIVRLTYDRPLVERILVQPIAYLPTQAPSRSSNSGESAKGCARTAPRYVPTPWEEQAAKIVEHYGIPLVMTPSHHATAIYVAETGQC